MRVQRHYDSSLYKSYTNSTNHSASALGRAPLQRDSVNLSPAGSKFARSWTLQRGEIKTGGTKSLRSLSDPSMRLAGKSIAEVRETLEEMKTLFEKARSSSLSWEERIDLQIEMTELQQKLYEKTHGMGISLARSDKAGEMVNLEAHEQAARMILFLEKLRSGGSSAIKNQGNVKIAKEGSPVTMTYSFYSTDFELDENGYIKFNDELFDSLPEPFKGIGALDRMLLSMSESESPLPKWMSDEKIMKNMPLSLLDAEKAMESAGKIREQLDVLAQLEAEFNRLAAVNPTVSSEYKTTANLGENFFLTPIGIMTYRLYKNNGEPEDPLDVRLIKPQSHVGKLFAKIDKAFKDDIFSSVGFGAIYKKTQKAKGVNPEQLASIEKAKQKNAEKDEQKILQRVWEDEKLKIPLLNPVQDTQ